MIKLLSSVRITVVCLFLLFVLTFWGTIAQVGHGLYAAQERFFASFFFLAGGWLPFPGAQFVLWVLFINLLSSLIDHFIKDHRLTDIGSKITHAGLLLYCAAAFFIFHLSHETTVRLMEGESTNVSVSSKNSSPGTKTALNHKSFPLPFTLRLDHFKAEFYLGTDTPKNFESQVTMSTGSLKRQARISMNNPLRYKNYTVYQASYDTDSKGRKFSTLAVVENPARFLPYISCLMVFVGLSLHFLIQAFVAKNKP